ncbi:MAG TPA: pentapeptide repeat-containing protein, partial [Candidatus Dormibacteraeota bacterium]|nr:pentapeptide repeat-containing protein [Candidatus Dormibacteraeota bacterium]
LEGADLSDADLSGTRFLGPLRNATAPRAKFVRANLGVDPSNQSMGLMRVDATGADFRGADFTGSSLRKALLARADFTGADLTDADVTYADLAGAILKDVRGRERIRGLERAVHVDEARERD